jgi:segregation and condensation protein B
MPAKTNLSAPAMETLAIVAYLQPVTRAEIEAVRGVNVDSVVSTLVDRRFIAETGRRDVPGRPMEYRTTPEFLESFGLRSVDELPPVDFEAEALELPLLLAPGSRGDDDGIPSASGEEPDNTEHTEETLSSTTT